MATQKPGQDEFRAWQDSQSGYIGKEAKADWWKNYNDTSQARQNMQNYIERPGEMFNVYGTGAQQQNVAANLSQVGAMTGQNIFDAGQQQQDYLGSLQDRRNGGDAVAAQLIGNRNRNVANVNRAQAGKGVAGGVAAAGANSAMNEADQGIASTMQKNSRQNDMDLWNYVKRNQKVTGEALAAGQDQGLAQGMDTSGAEGMFGTVICTELHRQGIMDDETYKKDAFFGSCLLLTDPHAMYGYRMMAAPVVRLMKKSKVFTRLIAIPALAWADQMAGKENFAGKAIMLAGIPFSRFVYRLMTGYYFCPEVREHV